MFSLASTATRKLLDEQQLSIDDIDLVIAATGTPDVITPSLASRVADAMTDGSRASLPTYDINAACSGYLYALANARDYVTNNPHARVLVLTSEVLSPLLDQNDFNTAVLFADAATASLVQAANGDRAPLFTYAQPTIAGAPEQNKGYGGVSIRFAPRQETRIESSEGPVAKDGNHNRHRWAQLEAQFAGGRAGVRIEADRRNPQFPNDWCLRHYGFVGANFPGVTPYRIDPAKPITLRYEIRVFDRPAAAARPSLP